MWRSSRSELHNEPRRCGPGRGFTLLEAMVSLLLLVIVLVVAMTMLFQMRAFAERQQFFMLPRQAARRAADYLSFYFAGASDLNYADSTRLSPNALIMFYNLNGALLQASYNNLTGTETNPGPADNAVVPPAGLRLENTTKFGDIGTDIITMVTPLNPGRYQVYDPVPLPALGTNPNLSLNFRVGCNCTPPGCVPANNVANEAAFKAATGDGTNALLMLVDTNGSWIYARIMNYPGGGDCNDVTNFRNIHAHVETGSATLPEPPHGVAGLTDPVYLVTGLQVISFRVLTDDVDGFPKLQQKLGLFDPSTDNPGTAFTNVMENVEDLQVAYMYSQTAAAGLGDNPLVWNTASQTINLGCPAPGCNVPFQAGPSGAPPPLDISNVIGVRISVTGRSPLLPLGAQKITNVGANDALSANPLDTPNQHFRPLSEDHAVDIVAGKPKYDLFDHYRATATLMLRNRIPRG